MDLVKIIGNLIDNAFDEANNFPIEEREVSVRGWRDGNDVKISVKNRVIPEFKLVDNTTLFSIGYSTKGDGEHQGLGLPVVKERVEYYRGTIEVTVEEGFICFLLSIPMQ
ncbi:sensory histidine kinase DcuS [compost metagenome]